MMEIKTETKVVTKHKVGVYFTLDELEKITDALYSTDRQGKLIQDINDIVRKAQSRINDLNQKVEKNITEDQVLEAQSGACTTGNCD